MMRETILRLLALIFGVLIAVGGALIPSYAAASSGKQQFAIANQSFWDYYQKRGGVRTFGYPISREFTLNGFRVQLFQRRMLQLQPNGSVSTMNLLDSGLMPYSSFNFSVVPSADPALTSTAPPISDPNYSQKAIDFVRANTPDQWNGLQVNFLHTFLSTVRYGDAFPNGDGNPGLVPLLNLELWGLPTSRPAYDPANHNFVYQRFQRGIMHYDSSTGLTQGLLLGDYFKSILTGQGLPADVKAEAASSPFYQQYDPNTQKGPLRPDELAATDLTDAFRPGLGDPRFGVVVAGQGSDDPNYVAASVAALGAGSWYSFSGNAPAVTGRVELVRPGADMTDLANRAKANPGEYWLIGNEPNAPEQDGLDPAAYADFLFATSQAIKGADPTAKLVGPNVLNWQDTCVGCEGITQGKSWSQDFLSSYTQRYGALPLSAWGVHTYSLDWNHLPLINAAQDQAQLNSARSWLDANGLSLPMWLSEFGVIWGYDGMQWSTENGKDVIRPAGSYREDLISNYMDTMFSWLKGPGAADRIERWFVYATAPPPEPYATRPAGISLLQPETLIPTPLGEHYQTQAGVAKPGN